MSKPEPPPLPQNTPPSFSPPPLPPQKPQIQSFVEYISAFNKPLTKDEKCAWLGEIAHRVLNNELPQEIYPFLRDKIENLPEAIPNLERKEEKIPGSDYVHPTGSKPYVPLIRENPTFVSDDLRTKPRSYRSKQNDSSFSTLLYIIVFFIICFIAYGIGSWYMKSPLKKSEGTSAEIAAVVPEAKPVSLEIKTDNPFEDVATDNPFEDGFNAIVTELEKEVFRLTLKLSDTEKCSYKIERTKTPLPERFEGRSVRLFPNAKSWRSNDGTITTIHDFKKLETLDEIFLSLDDYSIAQVSLDKSAGRLVMQCGPESWSPRTVRYGKNFKFPVEIIVDIDSVEYFNVTTKDYAPALWFWIVEGGSSRRIIREEPRKFFGFNLNNDPLNQYHVCSDWSNGKSKDGRAFRKTCENGEVEGVFDFPAVNLTGPLLLDLHCLAVGEQKSAANIGFSRIVTKGRFFDEELNADLRVRPIDGNGIELKAATSNNEIQSPDWIRKPYQFKTDNIVVESCVDHLSGMVVYRIDSRHLESGEVGIGLQFPKQNSLPKMSIKNSRVRFENENGPTMIGWSDTTTLAPPKPRKTLKIINAKFGADNRWVDATENVRKLITDNSLNSRILYTMLGDPAPTVNKSLVLTYSLDGEERTETIAEWQTVRIQHDPFFRLNVEKKSSFEFVVASGAKSLPEKLPTFEEVKRNNPFAKDIPVLFDNPFEESVATDNPFAE